MKTYSIQTNPSGTRHIDINEEHLATIERYSLFDHLIDSNGIVDESVLEKLRLTLRSLIMSKAEPEKELLTLALDVVFHNNMKALGLYNLVNIYVTWLDEKKQQDESQKIIEETL
jgi:hypothetical protein